MVPAVSALVVPADPCSACTKTYNMDDVLQELPIAESTINGRTYTKAESCVSVGSDDDPYAPAEGGCGIASKETTISNGDIREYYVPCFTDGDAPCGEKWPEP